MRRWFALILICLLFLQTLPVKAATDIQVSDVRVEYTFGEQVVMRAQITASEPIEEVMVFLRNAGETNSLFGLAEINQGEIIYKHDLNRQPLRAFSTISYWFAVKLQGGQTITTPPAVFDYVDNRFQWQLLESAPFRVHWYNGDVIFGQSVLDIAQTGLLRAQNYLKLLPPAMVDIYIYASGADMQSTLRMAGLKWVAGHASPDLSLVIVTLPPGADQRLETERQIPHELMHILLYTKAPDRYNQIPAWLNEGMASMNELYPNPDYDVALRHAVENDTLIPIVSLCQSFPLDASSVYLAYAEAASFTRYLFSQYGATGIEALFSQYANGLGCERGVEVAFGKTIKRVEIDWRSKAFGGNAVLSVLGNLLPWILLLVVPLAVPAALSVFGLRRRQKPAPHSAAIIGG
jgi:hypothetical protein